MLVLLIIIVTVLLIVLHYRYRKTVRLATIAEMREQELVADNEMLDRINRMKTEYIQNISHDFKTPLTVISTSVLNALDMLDFEVDKEEMRESLTQAQNEIMRLARIVDGALKHSVMYDHRESMSPIDIAPLLRNVARTYRVLLNRNGNTLTLACPNALPLINGNSDLLLNVLANLISNANRFTRSGEITLSALEEDDGDKVIISVADTGSGIKPELLPTIFLRGVSEGGTGLGLSIIKTAVEAHDGVISITSEIGVGTNVKIIIPAVKEYKITKELENNSEQ